MPRAERKGNVWRVVQKINILLDFKMWEIIMKHCHKNCHHRHPVQIMRQIGGTRMNRRGLVEEGDDDDVDLAVIEDLDIIGNLGDQEEGADGDWGDGVFVKHVKDFNFII